MYSYISSSKIRQIFQALKEKIKKLEEILKSTTINEQIKYKIDVRQIKKFSFYSRYDYVIFQYYVINGATML